MNILRYFSIVFLIYSISTFGQVHSGPATGNIASGVIVSTDNFPMVPIGMEPQKEQRVIPYMENDSEPIMGEIGNATDYENYFYVEDGNTNAGQLDDVGEHFMLYSFPAIPMTNSIPPDNHMAVGPDHVVATVNSRFHIYDREGNLLKNIDADAWCAPALPNPGAFDPQILFDHYENRWFMLWDNQNDATLTAKFIIAYSDDENPLGTWYMYAIDATSNGNTTTTTWGDYPQIGYDNNAIYINSRQSGFGGGYFYNKIRIINKSELYAANAGPLSWTDFWNISDPDASSSKLDVLHPVFSYDAADNTAYFLWANRNGSSYYVLYKIANPITAPVLTGQRLFGTAYGAAPNANQLGGGTPLIEANGSHIKTTPVVRDGKLYGTHPIRNTQFSTYTSLKYLIIDVGTNTIEEEVEFGQQGYFYLYPAIMVDKDHNIAITYSRSADTEYCGAYYSTKLATDPPGTLSSSHVMMEGQGNYVVTFSGTRNRWGDYLSAALDPANEYNIWLFSEYAAEVNTWGTWLTEIRMKPFTGVYAFTSTPFLEFGNIEVGTTSNTITAILANYGDQDLVITDIPTSMGEFSLDNVPTFPVTLSTYDSLSLDFTFSPTVPDSVEETFLVTSNDPNFVGFTLMGHGYSIYPALDKVMYASSGPQNGGEILSVNTQTGEGTNIGPSLFTDISGLTISPSNNELLGIRSTPSESEIVRVNSLGGDAYLLYNLDLGSMVAISFDNTGTLYGALETGEIYSIDLTNGSYSYVSTALIELVTIAFEPATNDLWATIKGGFGVPRDQIFKIDLPTGDTTLVGQTGLGNTAINALAFDENGVMYGIIGSGPTVSDLFTIDINTGVGTVVGSVGLQALTGLAFAETGVVNDLQDETNNTAPTDFALLQNYPNPFNPTTKIEFSLPIAADVQLVVYNILGQQVASLINEQQTAGNHSILWNADDSKGMKLSSGIYLYKLEATGIDGSEFQETRKMILLK